MKVKALIDFLKICDPEHEVQMVDPESGNIVNLYFEEKKDMVLVDPDEKFLKKIGAYKDKDKDKDKVISNQRCFQVGDIVGIQDQNCNHSFFSVQSVCLGGVGQENLIELISLSRKPGVDKDGDEVDSMYVPECLIDLRCLYHRAIPLGKKLIPAGPDGDTTI